MQNSGSPKPLRPPAACLPGHARSSAPPAGGQPFPTSDCGTCRSAPGRKWPNSAACERRGAFETSPTASEGPPKPRWSRQARSPGHGSGGAARDCGKRGGGRWGRRGRAGGLGERPRQPLWALRPASYQCPRPCRKPRRRNVERMLPSVLEQVLTPEPLSWGAGL